MKSEDRGIGSWSLRSKAASSSPGQLSGSSVIVCSWRLWPSTAQVCVHGQVCSKSQMNTGEDTRSLGERTSFLPLAIAVASLLPPSGSHSPWTHSCFGPPVQAFLLNQHAGTTAYVLSRVTDCLLFQPSTAVQ